MLPEQGCKEVIALQETWELTELDAQEQNRKVIEQHWWEVTLCERSRDKTMTRVEAERTTTDGMVARIFSLWTGEAVL